MHKHYQDTRKSGTVGTFGIMKYLLCYTESIYWRTSTYQYSLDLYALIRIFIQGISIYVQVYRREIHIFTFPVGGTYINQIADLFLSIHVLKQDLVG